MKSLVFGQPLIPIIIHNWENNGPEKSVSTRLVTHVSNEKKILLHATSRITQISSREMKVVLGEPWMVPGPISLWSSSVWET